MIALFKAEVIKLKRSYIELLLLGVPAILFVVQIAILLSGDRSIEWQQLAMGGAAIWAYFLLPMSATALTALMGLTEHGSKGWSYMLSLPIRKELVFATKAFVAMLVLLILTILIGFAIISSGYLAKFIGGGTSLNTPAPIYQVFTTLLKMWLASALLVAIQFFLAMRFQSFAVPIITGLMGTFIAVVATSAKLGIYFPWLLPTNILASDPSRSLVALLVGSIGGLIGFYLSCLYLTRRDWA